MLLFKSRHKHEMTELGKYYHTYETIGVKNGYDNHAGYGIHVEINTMKVCAICGKSEIENDDVRMFEMSVNLSDLETYIEELERKNIISEKNMNSKYQEKLKCIKGV